LAYVNPGEVLPCCCRPAPEARVDVEVIGSSRERQQEVSEDIDQYFEKLF
jgi:ferredoxin